jgi:hypothetical protein
MAWDEGQIATGFSPGCLLSSGAEWLKAQPFRFLFPVSPVQYLI